MYLSRLVRAVQTQAHSRGSVNPIEIEHFSRLSSQWWDEQGEFSFLHKMNPVRVQFIRQKLMEMVRAPDGDADVLRGLDVLDVGCGGGLLSESLARLGATTLGIDAAVSNVAIAQRHASADPGLAQLTYMHAPAEALLPLPKRYDVVCSMEVLEHVDHPAAFLATCAELLKPGGHLFLSTISRTPLSYLLTIFLAEDLLRKVSRGTHTYSKFIKPSELVSFFQDYRSPPSTAPVATTSSTAPDAPQSWISPQSSVDSLLRTQAEVRGLIYHPFQAKWVLAPRDAWGTTDCNYIFWVQKPNLERTP